MAFHYRRLGQNMRRIRLSANMTQRAVAEALGYRSCEHWSRIESGVRHIPLHILDSFCKVTGASYAEVLLGTTDVPMVPSAPLDLRQDYEKQFAEIIAAYPDEVVERILEICRQAVCLVDP